MKRWIVASLLLVVGCKNAPSEDQCKQLLDHLVDLEFKKAGATATSDSIKAEIAKQKAAVSTAKSAEFISTCVDKTVKARVECALKATDLGRRRQVRRGQVAPSASTAAAATTSPTAAAAVAPWPPSAAAHTSHGRRGSRPSRIWRSGVKLR